MTGANILKNRDLPLYACFATWIFISFACMAIPSPYCNTVKYLYIWLIAGMFNIIFFKFGKISRIKNILFALWFVHLLAILYLVLFTKPVRGSHRWLMLGGLSYQPSEGLKIFFVPIFSYLLAKKNYVLAAVTFLASFISLLTQPDLGNAIMLTFVAILILKNYGVETKKIMLTIIPVLLFFGTHFAHGKKRIDDFMKNESFQNRRAIAAISNGGLVGRGLGNGQIKKILPDAYSDFIFAVICEELGFLGCLAVCLSFLLFILHVFNVCKNSKISPESLSVIGLASLITFQAWIHIGSVTWIIPTKGTTLPFISHGGTSIVIMNVAFGMILSNIKYVRRRKVWLGSDMLATQDVIR